MVRVGSKQFAKLPVERKIKLLVTRGYRQAAFKQKRNAEAFMAAWQKKGYTTTIIRSTGPTIEEPDKITRQSYYVIARRRGR